MNGGEQSIRKYEFQLEQVRVRLEQEPNNQSLISLKTKLEKLIDLTTASLVEKLPLEKVIVERKDHHPITSIAKRPLEGRLPIKVGEACQVRIDGKWSKAVVQSVINDQRTCVVLLPETSETLYCKVENVRQNNSRLKSKESTLESLPTTTTNNNNNNNNGNPKSPLEGGGGPPRTSKDKVKKKDSKTDYIKKKEEEHREKQESWQKFTQKMGPSRTSTQSRPGL